MYEGVVAKLYHGHRKVAHNTNLVQENGGINMYLHGNRVAMFTTKHVTLYSAGRYTVTTKVRLNMALELAGLRVYLFQRNRNGGWYVRKQNCVVAFYDGMSFTYEGKLVQKETTNARS